MRIFFCQQQLLYPQVRNPDTDLTPNTVYLNAQDITQGEGGKFQCQYLKRTSRKCNTQFFIFIKKTLNNVLSACNY